MVVLCVLYIMASFESIHGRRGVAAPVLLLVCAVALHVQALILAPSCVYLVWWSRSRTRSGRDVTRPAFALGAATVIGAALGTVVGLFFGLPGIVIGPFAGAVLGEYSHRQHLGRAGRVGLGAWLGFALGLAGKIAITFTMIGIFAAAWIF